MLQSMRYIYEVYRQGSFSKAAKALYLTQPALSMAVKKEEERLGVLLFERGRTPIRLTQEGVTYIEAAAKIYEIEEELTDNLTKIKEGGSGTIRIGAASICMTYLLPEILEKFSKQYPGINVEVREDSYFMLKQMIKDEEIDLIIETEWHDEEIESKRLFGNHVLLAVPVKILQDEDGTYDTLYECGMTEEDICNDVFLREDAPRITMKEVKDLPYLTLQPRNEIYGRAKMIFDYYKIYPQARMSFNQQRTAFQYAKRGFGAAFVSDTLVKYEGDGGLIRYYQFDYPMPERYISISYKKNRYISHAMRVFMQETEEMFS